MTESTTAELKERHEEYWEDDWWEFSGILLKRLEAAETKRDGWKRTAEESETQFRMLHNDHKALLDEVVRLRIKLNDVCRRGGHDNWLVEHECGDFERCVVCGMNKVDQ